MGEKIYEIKGWQGEEISIMFSESDDEFGCLCTFPHNDQEQLEPGRVRDLALFGAAVRLSMAGLVGRGGYVFLPMGLPQWIVDGIRKAIPVEGRNDQ